MAAYRRVYDSRHLQAGCKEPGSAPEPKLGNCVRAAFTFLPAFYLVYGPLALNVAGLMTHSIYKLP